MTKFSDISHILQQIKTGEEIELINELYELVYEELTDVAGRLAAREQAAISTSDIVQETLLKLYSENALVKIDSRRYFFGVVGKAIRQILVDRAKARRSRKRGGEYKRDPFDLLLERVESARKFDFLELEEALTNLEEQRPKLHRVVILRFFAGLTIEQTALALSVSASKVEGDWRLARAWLYRFMQN